MIVKVFDNPRIIYQDTGLYTRSVSGGHADILAGYSVFQNV